MKKTGKSAARPAARGLDRERIVAAALGLVDRRGLRELSMRTLGAALGVEAMSLYKHFASKDEIVEALVVAALDEAELDVAARASWQKRIEAQVLALREVGLRHPDAFRLLADGPALGAASLRPLEALLAALADGGFAPKHAVSVMWTVVSYVLGSVTGELAELRRPARGKRKAPASPSADAFPNVASAAALLAGCDFEDELLAGLRRILAGAEAERPVRRRRE